MTPLHMAAAFGGRDPYGLRTAPPSPLMTPHRACEQCAREMMTRDAAFSRETMQVKRGVAISVPTRERVMRWQLRPVGGVCPRCGNTEPEGTWPIVEERGSVTRFAGEGPGETQFLVTNHERGVCMALTSAEYVALTRTPPQREEAA